MADQTVNTILSVCATTSGRVKDLPIKDGQLIFIQDKCRIAFDFKGARKFYNQIDILETDKERSELESPEEGKYYFVIDTAVLWKYQDEWVQLTTQPEEVLFIGTELPELGSVKTLYVDKTDRVISVWDEATQSYIDVANYTSEVTDEDIRNLFI